MHACMLSGWLLPRDDAAFLCLMMLPRLLGWITRAPLDGRMGCGVWGCTARCAMSRGLLGDGVFLLLAGWQGRALDGFVLLLLLGGSCCGFERPTAGRQVCTCMYCRLEVCGRVMCMYDRDGRDTQDQAGGLNLLLYVCLDSYTTHTLAHNVSRAEWTPSLSCRSASLGLTWI